MPLNLNTSSFNLNSHHPPADDRLHRILWNFHPLTILERGLVRDHAGESDIERVTHVDDGLLVQQDRLDEVVGELTVRATVATATHTGRQSRARTTDLGIVWFFPVDPALFTVRIFHVPAHRHARYATLTGFIHRDLGAEGVLVCIVLRLEFRVAPCGAKA